jgi:hypothetical protein
MEPIDNVDQPIWQGAPHPPREEPDIGVLLLAMTYSRPPLPPRQPTESSVVSPSDRRSSHPQSCSPHPLDGCEPNVSSVILLVVVGVLRRPGQHLPFYLQLQQQALQQILGAVDQTRCNLLKTSTSRKTTSHHQGQNGCTPHVLWVSWQHHQPRGSQTCLYKILSVPKARLRSQSASISAGPKLPEVTVTL